MCWIYYYYSTLSIAICLLWLVHNDLNSFWLCLFNTGLAWPTDPIWAACFIDARDRRTSIRPIGIKRHQHSATIQTGPAERTCHVFTENLQPIRTAAQWNPHFQRGIRFNSFAEFSDIAGSRAGEIAQEIATQVATQISRRIINRGRIDILARLYIQPKSFLTWN